MKERRLADHEGCFNKSGLSIILGASPCDNNQLVDDSYMKHLHLALFVMVKCFSGMFMGNPGGNKKMKLMQNILLLSQLLSFNPVLWAQNTVAFYFSAHEDDWQLFMNPNAYHDVQRASTKVVFVYLTAGDAGAGLVVGLTALDHTSPWEPMHRSWLSRHYVCVEPGSGSCSQ